MYGLGVSRTIYVNVDSPNLGFPYFLGEAQCKKHPVIVYVGSCGMWIFGTVWGQEQGVRGGFWQGHGS